MLETFYIIFVGLQKIIAIKDVILHLKKIMLFLLRQKKKNYGKKSSGKKMFSSYHIVHVLPIRNFRQWHKK